MADIFSGYPLFLLVTLVAWPLVIGGLLFAMSKIETRLERTQATTPEEAGLEPVSGSEKEREVKIVFGDTVVGEPPDENPVPGETGDAPRRSEAQSTPH